ncbi:MAG: DUF5343 domain-containing protein [Nisaea sp.]|uniref:DUF5343 domain-containing protein n=1 Tax=Nisaea sp. TaxID=2024842 RepID=UPI001B033CC9|nr:DUF5343 domain-containing protein [Nisaea sp.]MBO6562747.1 DUF5343 domain-containing protein [Nisaea sp.]
MASLPYVTSPGNIEKALNGIIKAAVPERVSQDFVKTVLGIPGGSGDQMTAFLKKIGFSSSDGKPTELYTKFRNPTSSGKAMAVAIKKAYAPLYVRNEFMHELSDQELLGLVVEETGHAHDSNPVKLSVAAISSLKRFADFKNSSAENNEMPGAAIQGAAKSSNSANSGVSLRKSEASIGLNLGYTIHLNLPATSDPAVFNAIFKSLKENLLRDEDA